VSFWILVRWYSLARGSVAIDTRRYSLPSRWHEARIIVLDTVMIYPPYEVENCKAEKDSTALQRVKMVVRSHFLVLFRL
jgi:hypothetical protein